MTPQPRPAALRARDDSRLLTVLPELRTIVQEVLAAMENLGYPMTVTAAVRTIMEQAALYAQGRSAPGRIVTNADGVVKKSNHQPKDDGFGYAVDCAFLVDGPDRDGELETPSWDDAHPWELYGAMGKALGRSRVVWGGDWKKPHDAPHLEWRA